MRSAVAALFIAAMVPLPGVVEPVRRAMDPTAWVIPPEFVGFLPVRDTVYTLAESFLELDLSRQRLILHRRTGEQRSFKVSSGAPWVRDGMETPTGLYTIQTKATQAISRQFDSTVMLWWMGFSGNIGFHALEGWGYYRHLGERASSHGCVRLSREDAQELYRLLPRGTPVLVYKEPPARVLAFLEPELLRPGEFWILSPGGAEQAWQLNWRLELLYAGRAYQARRLRPVLDGRTILRPGGYPVGEASRIPPQHPPLLFAVSELRTVAAVTLAVQRASVPEEAEPSR
jgi:hypothetical protein